jgi:hypothetical protein
MNLPDFQKATPVRNARIGAATFIFLTTIYVCAALKGLPPQALHTTASAVLILVGVAATAATFGFRRTLNCFKGKDPHVAITAIKIIAIFAVIGCMLGTMAVMANLQNPEKIGPGISAAFTILVWAPLVCFYLYFANRPQMRIGPIVIGFAATPLMMLFVMFVAIFAISGEELEVKKHRNTATQAAQPAHEQLLPVVRANEMWSATVPRKVCGNLTSHNGIDKKIADCFAQHSENKPAWDAGIANRLSWNGPVNDSSMKGTWTLVSVSHPSKANGAVCDQKCYETWRDDRTGLLWSDAIRVGPSTAFNWCVASGNAVLTNSYEKDADPTVLGDQNCGDTFNLNQDNFSLCEEKAGFNTPAEVAVMKGNFALNGGAQPGVNWRLPSRHDFSVARDNGILDVLPAVHGHKFWARGDEQMPEVFSFSGGKSRHSHNSSDSISPSQIASTAASVRCVAGP